MAKISREEEKKEWASIEMIKKCKSDIAKFGFAGDKYIKFLISVKAMKDESTVLKYPNHDMDKYRKMFLQKNEVDLDNDPFLLESFKIKTSDSDGKQYITGYFAPRSFWDKILETKTED